MGDELALLPRRKKGVFTFHREKPRLGCGSRASDGKDKSVLPSTRLDKRTTKLIGYPKA